MSRLDARTETLFLQPVALVPRRRPTQSSYISTSSYSNNHQEETRKPMNNDDRPCPSSQRHTIARTHARKPSPRRNKSTLLTLPVPIPSYRSPPSYKVPPHLGKSNPPLLSAPVQHYLYLSSAAPAEHAKQRAPTQHQPGHCGSPANRRGAVSEQSSSSRAHHATMRYFFCVDPVGKPAPSGLHWIGRRGRRGRHSWPEGSCVKRKVMARGLEICGASRRGRLCGMWGVDVSGFWDWRSKGGGGQCLLLCCA
jgi:hypothetical protein